MSDRGIGLCSRLDIWYSAPEAARPVLFSSSVFDRGFGMELLSIVLSGWLSAPEAAAPMLCGLLRR